MNNNQNLNIKKLHMNIPQNIMLKKTEYAF